MVARLVTGLTMMTLLKVAFRYLVIGPFTPAVVFLFAIVDAAMTIVMTPWVSMGRPLPARRAIYRRALLVAAVSTVVLALVNTALQVPSVAATSTDTLEVILRLALDAFPRSFFPSPVGPNLIGGLVVVLIASATGWAWMKLRLPAAGAGGRGRPGGPARATGGARRAGAGRAGRASSASAGRRRP